MQRTSAAIHTPENIDLASLAEQLACNLRPAVDVWNDHGVTDRRRATQLLRSPMFRQYYREARERWHNPSNARSRVQSKSLLMIETALPGIYQDVTNAAIPLQHRVKTWEFVGRLAGLDAEAAAAGGEGISIRIDLSGQDGKGGVTVVNSEPDRADAAAEDAEEADTDAFAVLVPD